MGEINVELINSALAYPAGFVAAAENAYYARIRETVDKVNSDRKVKVILLAGSSSSGKTTTANILKDAFIESGRDSDVISLDNFYRSHNAPGYPRLENGELDMECVGALDIGAIKKCIGDIIAGGSVSVPVYDFTTGSRKPESDEIFVEDDCVVIIEGLHALNPEITKGLDIRGCRVKKQSSSKKITTE